MDILKMLAYLREERRQVEEAIMAIEWLAAGTRGKRRSRISNQKAPPHYS
jgi:hypothetical protein